MVRTDAEQGEIEYDVCVSAAARALRRWSTDRLHLQTPRLHLTDERVLLRVFDGVHREIDVQVRPVQVMGSRKLDIRDFSNRRLPKPGKLCERYEELALADKQPEPVG